LGYVTPRKIGLYTLGCKLNQYETDSIAADFIQGGYQVVPFDQQADVYVINSCTVTNKADRKSRNIISRARKNPQDPLVVVTGCYADNAKEDLEKTEGIDYVVDNARKSQVFFPGGWALPG
jgi:threonylcarbamoyladenosine tRNA methylthiotransferase MtaB